VLQVASLGSGSAGNALLVRSSSTLLLLDCGFTLKETTARMARLGLSPADIHGVLHVQSTLAGINGLLVESNYDETMLTNGPYPVSLQARIRSDFGHLGNVQAGQLVQALDHADLQTILLGHLSEQNNTDEAAASTMASYLPAGDQRVTVLQQHACSAWFDIVAPEGFQFNASSELGSNSSELA